MSAPNWFIAFPVVAPQLMSAIGAPPSGVRAFHAEDLHVTVAFLGAVSEERAREGWNALRLEELEARAIVLGRVVPLGASALSAVTDDEPVTRAIGRARVAVHRAAEVRLDDRPPLAHVTIGRIARRADAATRQHAIEWAADLDPSAVPARIERVALYTWAANRAERLFCIVDARPL